MDRSGWKKERAASRDNACVSEPGQGFLIIVSVCVREKKSDTCTHRVYSIAVEPMPDLGVAEMVKVWEDNVQHFSALT